MDKIEMRGHSGDDNAGVHQKQTRRGFHLALLTQLGFAQINPERSEVAWTLPGNNQISGVAVGLDDVVDRAESIASYGPIFDMEAVLVSRDNMALLMHNQAVRGDLVLDERLATIPSIALGMIISIETYLSDLDGMNAFSADPLG